MLLTKEQIKRITRGAVDIECDANGWYSFYRFDAAQRELYRSDRGWEDGYVKTFATSGVRFSLVTDSTAFAFDAHMTSGSSRKYAGFDLYVDGVMTDHRTIVHDGDKQERITFALGMGKKTVEIYLPWSATTTLANITVDDGALIEATPRKKRMVSFGDSITQGYDAVYPSLSYIVRLADLMGVEVFNKGIGGEKFYPKLGQHREETAPDYVTVAYGTNDWNRFTKEEFESRSRDFIEGLSKAYPEAKIFVFTPIWREEYREERAAGPFFGISEHLHRVGEALPNVQVIEGFDLVPHLPEFYSDLRLHPNDMGFLLYAHNLYRKMMPLL